MKVLHDWLKEYVGDRMPEVIDVEKLFTFHAFEIDGVEVRGHHTVIDVKVLPDRSSDCLCHRGVAHELAALMGSSLEKDPLREPVTLEPKTEKLKVSIENTHACRRFSGALITGVTVGPSPEWLKSRLEALGQRSINAVVDATNYVMFSLGQPLHAYDADAFPHEGESWHFGVRMAREGEAVTTLSRETYTCTPKVQFITDAVRDTPVGIAGVKGGVSAEITPSTINIILEAANFDPVITRRSSQSLKLQTDASKRFENDLPPELTMYGLTECVRLILQIAGGTCEGYVDVYPFKKETTVVRIAHAHIERLLGLVITKDDVNSILARLGFQYTVTNDGWNVVAPFERTDVTIAEDVIADIGRIYGYDHVTSEVPVSVPLSELNIRHYYSELIRDALLQEGFSEVITSSFRNVDSVELANALASDKGFLRSSLKENIRETLDKNMPNLDLLRLRSLQIFEIGTVFNKIQNKKGVIEHTELALGVRTKQGGYVPKDDARLRDVIGVLENVCGVPLSHTIDRGVLTLNVTTLLDHAPKPHAYTPFRGVSDVSFASFSSYPFISRDVALWAEEGTTAEHINTLIKEASGELLLHSTLFDEFHKEDKVSYAFRLVFQSNERTLTDEEISPRMDAVYTMLRENGFEVR
jgi:phenylalanyl-tRNA synthetase beta chain